MSRIISHEGRYKAYSAKLIAPTSYALYCYCQVFPPTAVSFPATAVMFFRQSLSTLSPLSTFPARRCQVFPPTNHHFCHFNQPEMSIVSFWPENL